MDFAGASLPTSVSVHPKEFQSVDHESPLAPKTSAEMLCVAKASKKAPADPPLIHHLFSILPPKIKGDARWFIQSDFS
jgi:hypothetical protein